MTDSSRAEGAVRLPPEGGGGAPRRASVRRLGMRLFLASLGMLFAGSLVGYLAIRLRAPAWPPSGSQGLPAGLWWSTALVLLASAFMVVGERAVRRGRISALTGWLGLALALTVAFLAAQVGNWMQMAADGMFPQQSLAAFGFYLLTFLHAAHVLGGLVPMVVTLVRSRQGRYSAVDHEGVELLGMYWHFLAVTWVAIFAVLSF